MARGQWRCRLQCVPSSQGKAPDGKFVVGVRPEHVSVVSADRTPDANRLQAEIYTRQILGTDILYELTSNGHILRAVTPTSQLFEIGDRVGDWLRLG